MKIWLLRLDKPGIQCDGPECPHSPEYTWQMMREIYHIKIETVVAILEIDGVQEYYCPDCIDELYLYMKSKLDRRLWAFH